MTIFKAFDVSPSPESDGDHLTWMMGCDGEQHARWEGTITYEHGEGVGGVNHGAKGVGPCDGSCYGELLDCSGFLHP